MFTKFSPQRGGDTELCNFTYTHIRQRSKGDSGIKILSIDFSRKNQVNNWTGRRSERARSEPQACRLIMRGLGNDNWAIAAINWITGMTRINKFTTPELATHSRFRFLLQVSHCRPWKTHECDPGYRWLLFQKVSCPIVSSISFQYSNSELMNPNVNRSGGEFTRLRFEDDVSEVPGVRLLQFEFLVTVPPAWGCLVQITRNCDLFFLM